jgi:DNA-binding transcriptional LysR family regulator
MSLALMRYLTCRRTAEGRVPALHSVVQRARRQRAASAAPPLPLGQRCAPGARLAAGRSRERKRKAETEGQIKGVARRAPPSQSARGFAAAPQGVSRVPRRAWNPHGSGVYRVPLPMRCAAIRWSLHGWQ